MWEVLNVTGLLVWLWESFGHDQAYSALHYLCIRNCGSSWTWPDLQCHTGSPFLLLKCWIGYHIEYKPSDAQPLWHQRTRWNARGFIFCQIFFLLTQKKSYPYSYHNNVCSSRAYWALHSIKACVCRLQRPMRQFMVLLPKHEMDIIMGFAKARALDWVWQMICASVCC